MGFGYKVLVFCRNNGWLMENMDKGLTVPKWVLTNQPKVPQILTYPKIYLSKLSAQAQKFGILKKASLGVRSPWLHGLIYFWDIWKCFQNQTNTKFKLNRLKFLFWLWLIQLNLKLKNKRFTSCYIFLQNTEYVFE